MDYIYSLNANDAIECGKMGMNINDITNILETIVKVSKPVVDYFRSEPYGIVYKSAPITYMGKNGRLVWDYVVWENTV